MLEKGMEPQNVYKKTFDFGSGLIVTSLVLDQSEFDILRSMLPDGAPIFNDGGIEHTAAIGRHPLTEAIFTRYGIETDGFTATVRGLTTALAEDWKPGPGTRDIQADNMFRMHADDKYNKLSQHTKADIDRIVEIVVSVPKKGGSITVKVNEFLSAYFDEVEFRQQLAKDCVESIRRTIKINPKMPDDYLEGYLRRLFTGAVLAERY